MAAMAKKHDDDAPVLSEVEARAGVTGHHVRHVLVFGLAGSVIAFVVIALYSACGTWWQRRGQRSAKP